MELKISLFPEEFFVCGVNVGLSVVIAWFVIGTLVLLLAANYFFCVRHFQNKPKGLQLLNELLVDSIHRFAESKAGHVADFVAPFTLTMMFYVFFGTIVEMFGLPPATEDINCTFALGLFSFLSVNITGFREKGLIGRIKAMSTPSAVVFPIRVLTDLIAPCSMAIRLFANVLVGGVIMQIIYAVIPIIVPAALSSYFNVLHVLIQTFVFGLLSLTYTGEAVE